MRKLTICIDNAHWYWSIQNSFLIVKIFVGNVILLALALQQTVIYDSTIVCKLGLCCYVFIHNLLVTCQVHTYAIYLFIDLVGMFMDKVKKFSDHSMIL